MAYDNPKGIIAAAAIVQAIVYMAVALRFKARYKRGRNYPASDWLILVAAFLSTGLSIIQIYGGAVNRLGVPVHGSIGSSTFKESIALNLRWYQWAVFLNGIVVTGLIKISVSFFYLELFSVKYRHIIVPWLVMMILWTISFTILMLTFCGYHGLWPSIPLTLEKGQCLSGQKIGYSIVIGSTITDFLTVLIPLPMAAALRLPFKQRLAVMGVFAIGLLSVGGSVAKAYIYISSALKKSSLDYATMVTSFSVWGLVESQVGIIAACLMTLGPLIRDIANTRVWNKVMDSTQTLLGPLSIRSQTAGSNLERSKFTSGQSQRFWDVDSSQHDEKSNGERSYTTLPVHQGTFYVQNDIDNPISRA